MPSLLDTSLSGLRAYQGALSTTSQNIANVGNENYTRQRVEFEARLPIRQGSSFVGQGVDLTSVNRIIDNFNTLNLRELTSNTSRLSSFESLASRVESIIGDPQASLLPALDNYFAALNDVANDPSANAPRVALVGAAENLQQRFLSIGNELRDIEAELNGRVRNEISEINAITTELANLNDAITRISDVNNRPSDLLDKRDGLLKQLAEKISVTVVEQTDGNVNVLVGTGQLLVTNSTALTLVTQPDEGEPDKVSVAISSNGGTVNITSSLVGGELGGLLDFRDNLLTSTQNRLGRTAIAIGESLNAQNIQGYDLNGDLGTNLFNTVSTGNLQGQFGGDYLANGFDVGDTVSFNLSFDGRTVGTSYLIAAGDTNQDIANALLFGATGILSDANVTNTGGGTYTLAGTTSSVNMVFELYGSNIKFASNGGPSPLGNNLVIDTVVDDNGSGSGNSATIALSSLGSSSTRATAGVATSALPATFIGPSTVAIPNANNTGTGLVNFSITDVSALTNSNYEARFDGVNYNFVRLTDSTTVTTGAGPSFVVDGIDITVGGVPVAGDSFIIRPTKQGAVSFQSLLNDPAKVAAALPVRATSSAANLGDVFANQTTIVDSINGDLNRTVDIVFDPANPANSFDVIDRASGTVLQNDVAYFDGITVTQNGWQLRLSGVQQVGDTITVQENINGAGDNRNMLLLAGFQNQGVLDNNNATFEQTYNALTSEVGVVTQQVKINLDVENSLLQNAFAQRESVSGVNLDEEAADLIRFQQAYQALSRIIQTSQELFASLLAAV